MWWLFKTVLALAVVGTLGYLAFTQAVGGATVASHLADIWSSPVVQRKVELVRNEVTHELAEKLDEARTARAHKGSTTKGSSTEEITEHDRAELEALLERSVK